jgi:hypothetical protein
VGPSRGVNAPFAAPQRACCGDGSDRRGRGGPQNTSILGIEGQGATQFVKAGTVHIATCGIPLRAEYQALSPRQPLSSSTDRGMGARLCEGCGNDRLIIALELWGWATHSRALAHATSDWTRPDRQVARRVRRASFPGLQRGGAEGISGAGTGRSGGADGGNRAHRNRRDRERLDHHVRRLSDRPRRSCRAGRGAKLRQRLRWPESWRTRQRRGG